MQSSVGDEGKIAAIRQELPAVTATTYLNAGTNGPLPRRSVAAAEEESRRELEEGRISADSFHRFLDALTDTRAAFAGLWGCSVDEVALTHNTTEGMNIALLGLDWQPRDEVITAETEHPGGLYPCLLLHQRHGVKIRMTRIGAEDVDPIEELRRALTPRTRAVAISHVSWSSGRVLPIRELADVAHEAGALLICDAAQGCGMVPSPVYELGVDAYACSGQKWLCGPQGTGGLFVRRDRLRDIQQTYIGYLGAEHYDLEGHFVPPPAAKRYEMALHSPSALASLRVSLDWLREEVGWEWIYARVAELGRYCYDQLAALPHVRVRTPRDAMAGLVTFAVEGMAPNDVTRRLAEQGILIRDLPHFDANRASTGFYNTHEDLDRLVAAVAALA